MVPSLGVGRVARLAAWAGATVESAGPGLLHRLWPWTTGYSARFGCSLTRAPVQPSAPKVRTLLALLLLNRDHPVGADRIVDTLWGDEAPRSAHSLVHGYVRDLRHWAPGSRGS